MLLRWGHDERGVGVCAHRSAPGAIEDTDAFALPELRAGLPLILRSPDGDSMADGLERPDFGEGFGRMDEALVLTKRAASCECCDAVELTGLPLGKRSSSEGDDRAFDDDQTSQTGIPSFFPWTLSRVALASRMARHTVRSETPSVSAMSMGLSPACS